ncbi:DUF1294 domain-containing protein [Ammoniphilus sp. YIM 78166]|uniref:DUF1294 domain-containing protein n=1 Tax=Ammoniphilus sp. YIM 78166 TaxID=1644106 RepID=UPI00106F702D|nr:DUF1294 domain-containing protein [Ammoniphilus sp. YIM 78166]
MIWLLLYILVMNLITYVQFAQDKRRARQKEWRISEKRLLTLAFLGGSLGAWRGMKDYYHKINQLKFKTLVPLSILLHAAALAYLFFDWGTPNDYLLLLAAVAIHGILFSFLAKNRR